MPDAHSRVAGAVDCPWYPKIAFAIPKEVIAKMMISRYPVNFTGKCGLLVLD
jgi:hypothetical protein